MDPSINFGELRSRIPNWSIEDEEKLLNKLKAFSDSYLKSADGLNRNLQCFSNNLTLVSNDYNSSINTLRTLSLKKFFEHKVDKTEAKQVDETMPQQPFLSNEEALNQMEGKYKSAIAKSLEAVTISQNQTGNAGGNRNDAESMYDDGASETGTKMFSKGMDKANKNLKMPYVIGTRFFEESEYCGLCFEEADEINKKMSIMTSNTIPKAEDMKDGQEYIIGEPGNIPNVPVVPSSVPVVPAVPNLPSQMTISQIPGANQAPLVPNIPVANVAMAKVSNSGVPVPPPMNLPMPVIARPKPQNAERGDQAPVEKKVLQCHQPQKAPAMDLASLLKQKIMERERKINGQLEESSTAPIDNPIKATVPTTSTNEPQNSLPEPSRFHRSAIISNNPNALPTKGNNITLNQFIKDEDDDDDDDDEKDVNVAIYNKTQQDTNKQSDHNPQIESRIKQNDQPEQNKKPNFFDIDNDNNNNDNKVQSNLLKKYDKLNKTKTKLNQMFEEVEEKEEKKEKTSNIMEKTNDLTQKLNQITGNNTAKNNTNNSSSIGNAVKGPSPAKHKNLFDEDEEEDDKKKKPVVVPIAKPVEEQSVKLNPIDEMKRKLEENSKKKEASRPSYEPTRNSKPSEEFSQRMSGLANMFGGRMPGAPAGNSEIRHVAPENTNKDEPELTEKPNIEEILDQKVVIQKKKPKRKGFNATEESTTEPKEQIKPQVQFKEPIQSKSKQPLFSSNPQPQPQAPAQSDLRSSIKTTKEPQKRRNIFFDEE